MAELPIDDPRALSELTASFERYEAALGANDVPVLDELFLQSRQTVRYGIGENLYGFSEIEAFRAARPGGSPPREIVRTSISTYGRDFGTTHIEFRRRNVAATGRQTQSWIRTSDGWKIVSAHVSMMQDFS